MRLLKSIFTPGSLILFILTIFGAFLHFYNLNWGAPYYFHPDERNVASAISQLRYPDQFNPHFFAYGSLPIYTVFLTGLASKLILHQAFPDLISFDQAILIGRVYSAFFATALIPLLYAITRMLLDHKVSYDRRQNTAIFVASLTVLSAGIIQFAHFSTFEMWLTFFTVLLFGVCLKLIEKKTLGYVFLLGLIYGVLLATKISSLALLPLPLLAIAFAYRKHYQTLRKRLLHAAIATVVFICTLSLVYIISNPFVFLDTPSFISSMQYESGVGLHTVPVFYTQAFNDTIPVLYQFINIYPFLLNPLLTFLLIPSFLYLLWYMWRTRSITLFLLNAFFLILFFSQAILFIKWTRYMLPTLPFAFLIIALAITYGISDLSKYAHSRLRNNVEHAFMTAIIFVCSIFALSYFITAYVQPDTRLVALNYAKSRIPTNAVVLSETYDIGITAFNDAFPAITLFNTYDTDDDSPDYNVHSWKTALESADYIILPSQRVLQARLQNPKRYPIGNTIYNSLLNGDSGFEKIYETPCDIFCQIAYLGDPVLHYEQTATVFDRPTVYIFRKSHE